MLQSISDKLKSQRWLMTGLLGLLALIFAAWGAYGIVNVSFSPQDYGLKVNGERVSTETLNRAWQERQAQYAQALNGATLPPAQTRMLQQQLLNEYVRETLLRQRAQASGYRASDAQVLAAYQSEPGFQVDGKFSALAAKTMLAQIGLTPETYEAERRQALQISQLTEGIQLSDFLTAAQLNRIYALENEQREVRYALLPAERYAAAVTSAVSASIMSFGSASSCSKRARVRLALSVAWAITWSVTLRRSLAALRSRRACSTSKSSARRSLRCSSRADSRLALASWTLARVSLPSHKSHWSSAPAV